MRKKLYQIILIKSKNKTVCILILASFDFNLQVFICKEISSKHGENYWLVQLPKKNKTKKNNHTHIWWKFMNFGKTFVEPPWVSGLFETRTRWVSDFVINVSQSSTNKTWFTQQVEFDPYLLLSPSKFLSTYIWLFMLYTVIFRLCLTYFLILLSGTGINNILIQ